MAKGSSFEREMAKQLSLWWSTGSREDLFWRSAGSGGRATQRAKSGKSTANSAGDLMAMDADGQKLLDVVTIELKRGYNSCTIQDLFDKANMHGGFCDFVAQAMTSASLAGTPHWMVIHKRDRRDPVVVTSLFSEYGYFLFYRLPDFFKFSQEEILSQKHA
jgi:hypothetical protein